MRYSAPKGVFDILPTESSEGVWTASPKWQYLEETLVKCAQNFDFQEIRTPIFESTDLFVRGVGEGSDIVNKEMYTFEDKGNRSLTLRPEGTAAVMRAYIEHKLYAQGDRHKFFYIGPMFRYERPQAGRYRQHHQFGAEAIGCPEAYQDAEIIDLALEIYRRLGIKNLKVLLNSVGNKASREAYKTALESFLMPKRKDLSADSQVRFEKNMLRILDSKDPQDQALLQGCPNILEFLDEESLKHFESLQKTLQALGIEFEISPKLVRGLDYYNKTVFEVITSSLGAQNTIGAGGRYDGLIESFGGPAKPSVGFATGMERILQTMLAQAAPFPAPKTPFIYLIGLGEPAKKVCFELLATLRHQQIPSDMQLFNKKIQVSLSTASDLKARFCFILGDQELQDQTIKIKDFESRQETLIPLSQGIKKALELWADHR